MALLATKWPTGFADADVAAKYIAGVCALNGFKYTPFEGVSAEKFQTYVTWNTARRAWEEGKLNLSIWPKEWKRKKAANTLISQSPAPRSTGPQTMTGTLPPLPSSPFLPSTYLLTPTDAIEADIARLLPLIHAWPIRFSDINEARNYIGSWCHDNKDKFRYAGWADVELRKYCLFVNFNAAKYALEDGLFKVEREVPEKRSFKKSAGCGVDKNFEQPNDVQIVEGRVDNTRSDAESTGGSSAASSETTCSENEGDAQNEEKEAAAVVETTPTDPFKVHDSTASHGWTIVLTLYIQDLVAALQRSYAVQPAFDLLD